MRELITDDIRPQDEKTNEDGFTLVEILVVIVIIGILTTAVTLSVLGRVDDARATRAKSDIRSLESAVELYRLDMGTYPEALDDLVTPPRDSDLAARFPDNGYVKFVENDPWGRPYVYTYPGENGKFDIVSYGEDGREGGEELAADIVSWER